MTRKEIEQAAFDYINSEAVKAENMQLAYGDFINGAEWMQKKMIDKACEYAKSKYDLDYCANVKDVLNYLKSMMEE